MTDEKNDGDGIGNPFGVVTPPAYVPGRPTRAFWRSGPPDDSPVLRVKRIDPRAKLPTYATEGSAGLDLYALERGHLEPGTPATLRTGIAVEIPPGFEGQIRGRSGLAFKHRVFAPHIGTIDADYRGEIQVLLEADDFFGYDAGDRIAQLIIAPVARVHVHEAEVLSETKRGEGGFGSSGR